MLCGVWSNLVKFASRIFAVVAIFCRLLASRADTIQDHQITQARPIQLGTSGGNINDESARFCCNGTLGALVQDRKGRLFVLSNNHVLARTNRGHKHEPITQPGLVDAGCERSRGEAVATLTKRLGIYFGMRARNVADAAIARVLPNQVDPNGNIIGIGTLGTGTVEPFVDLPVKKSGRTTGLTHGAISAVEVSLLVTYNKRCGVGRQTAPFVHQIRISPGNFGSFSQGGDSGSLVVEDTETCPRAVGLLFAGGGGDTFANPIGPILSKLKLRMVGCPSTSDSAAVLLANSSQRRETSPAAFSACKSVKEAAETDLLNIPGVVGVGIGLSGSEPTEAAVEVYSTAEPAEIREKLPAGLTSVPLKIIKTGPIHAL